MAKKGNIKLRSIIRFNMKDLKGLNELLLQWSKSGYQMTPKYFRSLIKKSNVLVLYDGQKMVGTVTLIPMYKLSGMKGSIEHLLIDEKYQGRGLGKRLMLYVIELAKKLGMEKLFLTCAPQNTTANSLYEKLGFSLEKIHFYSFDLKNLKK